jgi:aminoglycoside phosphotransferase (APT) family kinase protein
MRAEFAPRIAQASRMPDSDTSALAAWLFERIPELRPPLTLRRFAGGQSNPTYALETPGARLVLRAKPAGPLLPSAHAIEREFRVLRALEATPVPVPRTIIACDDSAVFGTPFYVMEYLDGRVFTDPALPGVDPAERTALYESAFATLADLHRVDFRAVGLADYGRADGYLARQVLRWTKQYRASQTDDFPSMEALIEWLPANVPATDEAAIAHGDYRIGNLLFAADAPRVRGVLDWELSTIGHPLLDLAGLILWHDAPFPALRLMGAGADLSTVAGIPDPARLVDVYCRQARRAPPGDLRFFLALALFRSAAIMQGIRHRIALGNAAGGPEAAARAAATPLLADAGWALARAGGAVPSA